MYIAKLPGVNGVVVALERISKTTSPRSQKSSLPDTAGQSPSLAAACQGSLMLPAHPGPNNASAARRNCRLGMGLPRNWTWTHQFMAIEP